MGRERSAYRRAVRAGVRERGEGMGGPWSGERAIVGAGVPVQRRPLQRMAHGAASAPRSGGLASQGDTGARHWRLAWVGGNEPEGVLASGLRRRAAPRTSRLRHELLTSEVAVVVGGGPPAGGVAEALAGRVAKEHLRTSVRGAERGKTTVVAKGAGKTGARPTTTSSLTALAPGRCPVLVYKVAGPSAGWSGAGGGRSPPGGSAAP